MQKTAGSGRIRPGTWRSSPDEPGCRPPDRLAVRAVATVLPFRANTYVIEELIDWTEAPDDPIYRLVFPQPDMLPAGDVRELAALIGSGAPGRQVRAKGPRGPDAIEPAPDGPAHAQHPEPERPPAARPAAQVPGDRALLPRQGQTCHAYCTYCFRWAQFVGEPDLKMATDDIGTLIAYLRQHAEVTSVLITGCDPMIMAEPVLRRYIGPLLDPSLEHLESIRIGTKSLAYWPQRYLTDPGADATLRLFEQAAASDKSLALMAHFSHPRELETGPAQAAARKITSTGAVIRTQAPLIRSVNDNAAIWREMWRAQLRQGMVPYYMFIERDTGPQDYFAVPLARGYEIFRDAFQAVSGLCRTVRGPSMSATPGKITVDGITDIQNISVFVLRMIQARDPSLAGQPFFAHFDPAATWITDLQPAFAPTFPYETGTPPAGPWD
jgi:L-lysine 2,3-aminomutase